ncbi:MAG TPA: chorismate mutase family protein [Acidimicrobiales bacterium]|nr:chorismate mutase family protein [Acidimicrobiales bacterium]
MHQTTTTDHAVTAVPGAEGHGTGTNGGMATRAEKAEEGLAELRRQLDGVDARLLVALRDRLECCKQIAVHKLVHDIPMMQPGRISVVQARAAAFAESQGMDPNFLRDLYERIISETCRVETEIIDGGRATVPGGGDDSRPADTACGPDTASGPESTCGTGSANAAGSDCMPARAAGQGNSWQGNA